VLPHSPINKNGLFYCPCEQPYSTYVGKVPKFVGSDFFCETGCEHGRAEDGRFYTSNKLWDGKGCGTFPGASEGTRDPWFHKEFSYAIRSDIEVRSCLDQVSHNEDLLIEKIHLYIQ